ncbi:MFS transporter [Vibrio azureus]|nr:MFS transporter [Vibrio azureus]AUI87405.1 MFS transporter [Vibrio azureus]
MPQKLNKYSQLTLIGFSAALMGVGQNGLLVSLPFLVERTAFNLPIWSMLIAIGSFLFLPSAPFWGRYSDKFGPKKVVLQALLGMAVSFSLLCLFAFLSNYRQEWAMVSLLGLLFARIIYGCTVAGMVPASQHWAIILYGKNDRLQAITTVSIGLSAGRLVGPLLSILMLKLSPFAPLLLMIVLPCIALLGAISLPSPKCEASEEQQKKSLSWYPPKKLLSFLLCGLFLCSAIALLQYSFSPLIFSITSWSTEQISDSIGVLLTIRAGLTFLTQVMVIKKNKLNASVMYLYGSIALLVGFMLFLIPNIWGFVLAMAMTAIGSSLLVPAYTSVATEQQSHAPGAIAGYISMSHTIGYSLASLLVFSVTLDPLYPIYLCIGFSICILLTALSVSKKGQETIRE